jgi:hypothetical protein
MDLFDTLIENAGAQTIYDAFGDLMAMAARHSPVEVLQHVTKVIPLVPTLPQWKADELVSQACDPPGDIETLRYLLDLGLNIDAVANTADGETQTALHGAAAHGSLKAVELLWSRGARVIWDDAQKNALDRAKLGGHKAVVQFLEGAFDKKGIPHGYGEKATVSPEKQAYYKELVRLDREYAKTPRWWRTESKGK